MYHRHNLTSLHYVLIHSRTPQKQSSKIALLSGLWNRTGNLYISARMKAPLENRGREKRWKVCIYPKTVRRRQDKRITDKTDL